MDAQQEPMRQVAPHPQPLVEVLGSFAYNPPGREWVFSLKDVDRGQGSAGLTLVINITGPDTYDPVRWVSVDHLMPVPPAAWDERSWQRWLFDQIGLVELHERMEFFKLGDERPYAPSHGPGNDPYLIREVGTITDQRTSFRGEVG